MAAEALESQRFGRYETLFRIAGGGMAEVYAARALGAGGFQKLVALKRMRPELAEDARFVTMFLDEGRVAANIQSPNVVSTLDLGRAEDNSLYLVMELVTGVSMQTLLQEAHLRQERIPVPITVDIIAQAANGLHAAHEAKSPTGEPLEIVHRDCSPHNILIDTMGIVKITDFGIAKAMERQTHSVAGEMKGKLSYLSPEQARGLSVDRRADTFILGIVAWEAFAQTRLFESSSPVEALHKVVMMDIPKLNEITNDVSPEIAAVVARALERDPDLRFTTAAAFGEALLDALGTRPPPRTALGAFVRRCGGVVLDDVETGIRTALGRKLSQPPPAVEGSYPIPLTRPLPTDPAPMLQARTRERTGTVEMTEEERERAPSHFAPRETTEPMSEPPPKEAPNRFHRTETTAPMSEKDTPRVVRERAATIPMPEEEMAHAISQHPPVLARHRARTLELADEPSGNHSSAQLGPGIRRTRSGTVAMPERRLLSVDGMEKPEWERPPSSKRGGMGRTVGIALLLGLLGAAGVVALWYSQQPAANNDTDSVGNEVGNEVENDPPPIAEGGGVEPTAPLEVEATPLDENLASPTDPEAEPEVVPEPVAENPTPPRRPRRPRRPPRDRTPSRETGPGTIGSPTTVVGDRQQAEHEIWGTPP